jgi:mannonate dehydratase
MTMSAATNQYAMRAFPGYFSSTEGIQLAIQTHAEASNEDLQFYQQLGVEWAMVGIHHPEQHTAEFYKGLVKRFGEYGLKIYRITNLGVHNSPEMTLNLPGRDAKIEEFKRFIRNLGAAGIKYNTYAHMGNGIWTTGHVPGRGGMNSRMLDITNAKGHWAGTVYEGELTHGRRYTEDELWDNYTYMIRQIAPVAEEAGVYIGIHPDDPPVYDLGGIPRCMFGNFAGYKKAMEIARRWRSRDGCGRSRRHQALCCQKAAVQGALPQRYQPDARPMGRDTHRQRLPEHVHGDAYSA